MNGTRWLLRAIFLLGFAVSWALAFVPGAKEVGQSAGFDSVLGTVVGLMVVAAMLVAVIRGERAAWLLVFGLVTLRTLLDLAVAIDDPKRALGWASAGSWAIVALAAWGLRPENALKRRSTTVPLDSPNSASSTSV